MYECWGKLEQNNLTIVQGTDIIFSGLGPHIQFLLAFLFSMYLSISLSLFFFASLLETKSKHSTNSSHERAQ